MRIKLNAFRDGRRPGDVIDVSDSDGATLIEHGAGFPADDVDEEGDGQAETEDQAEDTAGTTVSGSAELSATSGTETAAP